jgi:predicted enzyme related to lactoylglutathione lyase
MNRLVHFEIHVDNPERAIKFYEDVFNWRFEKWEGGDVDYWMIYTGDKKEMGIDGGMLKRQIPNPKAEDAIKGYVCTMLVDDIDKAGEKIIECGGKLAVEKVMIADMAWQAYYIDTEGNIFGIHQPIKK